MAPSKDDYRDILLQKYEVLKKRNGAYSIRRYAKDLGLEPSNLSDVLKGRCGLSPKVAVQISERLQMSAGERDFFRDLVESQHSRNRAEREAAQKRLLARKQNPFARKLAVSKHSLYSKWYYVAALELVTLTKGLIDSSSLADRLAITKAEAKDAFDVLKELGLIKQEGLKLVRLDDVVFAESPSPVSAIRSFHKGVSRLAQVAVDEQEIPARKFLTTMMTVDRARLSEARDFLEAVNREFFEMFESKTGGDAVYSLSLQFFRIDRDQSQ